MSVDSQTYVTPQEFSDALWETMQRLYGEVGASKAGLSLIDYDTDTCRAVVRVANVGIEMVRSALALVTRAGDKRVAFHVIRVSGTLKALRRKVTSGRTGKNYP